MALYIVPVFIIFIFVFACLKHTDAYGGFVKGAKDAIALIFDILPYKGDKEIYNIVINEKKNIFKRNKSKRKIINT